MTDPKLTQDEARARANEMQATRIAEIGVELMNAYNKGKRDPSDLAVMGHDTATGYEFVIERDGVTYIWSGTRDLA